MLHDGWVGHRHVVPESWLQQALHIDADIRGAFAASDSEPVLPGGWYRNQFWFVPGPSGDILLCLGIHGQMVFVDRATRTVAVSSSWPTPQDPTHLVDTIRAFAAVGRHLSGLEPVGDAAVDRPPGQAASWRVRSAGAGNGVGHPACAYLTYPIGTTVGVSGSFSLVYFDRMPSM